MYLLKYLLQNAYYLIKNKEGRLFAKFLFLYGTFHRNQNKTIQLYGNSFKFIDNLSFLFQFKEIFVDQFYQFNPINKKPIIIDCGANIGTSCLFFLKNYKGTTLIALEPNNAIFQILTQNLISYKNPNLKLINKAAWKDNKGIKFYKNEADSGGIIGNGDYETVESLRIADLINEYKTIDLLKIDIEGAEYEVIKDCKPVLNKCHAIFIEYHSYVNDSQNLGEILTILEESGFRYYLHNNTKINQPLIKLFTNLKNKEMDFQINIFAQKI